MIRWCTSQNDGCQNPYQQDWTASKRVLTKTRSRLIVVMSVFVLAYGIVCARMAQLTMENYIVSEEPDTPTAAKEIAAMERADILDREGHLIATSLKTASLYADPKIILNSTDAAKKLTSIFPDLDYNTLQHRLSSKRRFVWIKRNLTPKQIYAANRLGLPGVNFIDEQRRVYPDGSLLAHAVGFTDVDHRGLAGLEKAYNKLLLTHKEPLQTTLDVRVQHILRKELQKIIADFTAIGGAGLVMDAKTGEIYAMVSLPDFDPHHPASTPDEDRFNRLTAGVYEMGSTFKTFTTAALFENNGQNPRTVFDTTHPLRRAGYTISDFHPEPHNLNVTEIMIHSSNIGAALMAEKIGTPKMKQFYKELGFLDEVPIDLAERGRPLYPKEWRDINTLTAAYGHGIAVTPLHLATAMAAMVNGGYLPKPTFIKKPDENYELEKPEPVISAATSHMMRNVLRMVVSEGTGGNANIPGYHVGGKTGTAEKTVVGGYNHKALLSSFIGVFPVDDPKFVVVAFIDEPKPNARSYGYATGGWTGAPVVGQVIRQMAPLVGIAPTPDTNLLAAKQATGLMPQSFEGGRLASY
ncbi:MAG TPA: penicillin-binding protein 2 [Alphaproteobacteria bacterium]